MKKSVQSFVLFGGSLYRGQSLYKASMLHRGSLERGFLQRGCLHSMAVAVLQPMLVTGRKSACLALLDSEAAQGRCW